MSLTVIGMGNKPNQITLEGVESINKAKTVIVKTIHSPNYAYFENIAHTTLDEIFNSAQDFDQANERCAKFILSQKGSVVFCLDGDGVNDGIVEKLLELTKTQPKIIYGVSNVAEMKAISGGKIGYALFTATDLITKSHVEFDRSAPIFITEIDDEFLASDLKLFLLDKLGDEEVLFFHKKWTEIKISELDRQRYSHLSSCVIPTKKLIDKERFGITDLIEIMKLLRAPEGCPWDRAQTHESIRKNLIEEAYELDEAIFKQDIDMMTEECGDVLLQAVFNALIGEEEEEFTFSDVMSMLCLKLINRHTHIFGDVKATNATEALLAWENAKKKEKAGKGKFDTVPAALPALIRAQKVMKCAGEAKNPRISPKGKEAWGRELFEAVRDMRAEDVDGEEALQDAIANYVKAEEDKLDS